MSAVTDFSGGGGGSENIPEVAESFTQDSLPTAILENMVDSRPSENANFKPENSEVTESTNVPDDINTPAVVPEEIPSCDPKETPDDNPLLGSTPVEQPKELELSEKPEDEWLDILNNGEFKKKVIKPGPGENSKPVKGDWVTANISCHSSNDILIEKHENFKFRLGDLDVVPGLEMAVSLMELGEKSEVLVPAKLAYGKFGRKPDIPPHSDLKYEVEVLTVQDDDDSQLSFDERFKLGNDKRDQGNYWYGVEQYVNAIHCYQRAAEYLDGIDGSDNPPQKLQEILDTRVKVNNNLAAAHLKMEAHDAALRSLDFVLKMQPNNVKAHYRKGKILANKGMIADALAEMKLAANFEPESKVIQQELQKLQKKKKDEDNYQKAMYQRMFPSSTSKPKTEKKSWFQNRWSLLAGGMAAVAAGVAAYRQFH